MKRKVFLKNSLLGAGALFVRPFSNNIDNSGAFQNTKFDTAMLSLDLTKTENIGKLNALGYENVLAFGADPTGTKDSTAAIQAAIDAGDKNFRSVLFPLGTYIISKTLRCYRWWSESTKHPVNPHLLIGENRDGKRPLIKLAASAPLFDEPSDPRPMIAYEMFFANSNNWDKPGPSEVPTDEATLSAINPIKGYPGFKTAPLWQFDEVMWGIDFDCNRHSGAVGIYFAAAQKSLLANAKVLADKAHTGIWGIPGRNSGAMNIEVHGGRIGLKTTTFLAGATAVGVKLFGQTESSLVIQDFVPFCLVGFHIKKSNGPVITMESNPGTANGSAALIDGVIEMANQGLIIDNKIGKTIYVRNVFVNGKGPFIASGTQSALTGSGKWYRVAEYAYTDQTVPVNIPAKLRDNAYRTYSIVNGELSRVPVPVVSVQNNTTEPPDYSTGHVHHGLLQIPFADSSKFINIMDSPYNAVADDRDNWAAIQGAIDDAEKAGKTVYVPKGIFLISKTLHLKKNTKLIGLGCRRHLPPYLTAISAHPSWQKVPGNEALVKTVDDPEAETFLCGMNLIINDNVIQNIHWQSGRKSSMMCLGFDGGLAETAILFTDNGGGRHYLVEPHPFRARKGADYRQIRMTGTSQPLSWYGCNLEGLQSGDIHLEMLGSANIRIYGIKREQNGMTMVIKNCRNIGVFGLGAMREGLADGLEGFLQIKSTSDGILMAPVLVQMNYRVPNNVPVIIEALDGKEKVWVNWPEGVSIYKRGELDDSKMYVAHPGSIMKSGRKH